MSIPLRDLKFEVNRVGRGNFSTSVRAIHLPTGYNVTCDTEPTQLQNHNKALASLTEILEEQGKL